MKQNIQKWSRLEKKNKEITPYDFGGTLGSITSGITSGASIGVPWGAAIGGAVGLVSGLFNGKKEKEAKQQQELLKKQQVMATKQQELMSIKSGQGLQNAPTQYALGGYLTPELLAKSGIHIKPENKGKFTATKKATGKTTEELTHSKNPLTRKRANFARMAKRGWKPLSYGGFTEGSEHDLDESQIKDLISKGYAVKYI